MHSLHLSWFTPVLADAPAPSGGIFWLYAGFIAVVLVFLALDLGVFNRDDHVVSSREALLWSILWAACAAAFGVFVYFAYQGHWFGLGLAEQVIGSPGKTETLSGGDAAGQFLAGYLVEWSLSVDNLFVIALIFRFFAVPPQYQHRVLFWGILGALIMRGGMIALGAVLLHRFSWITYVFGGILVLTAAKMALSRESEPHPDRNMLVRLVRRFWPVSSSYDGHNFFTRVPPAQSGSSAGSPNLARRAVTPLFLALLTVEFTDVLFAVDSVPAVFSVTADPFLVLTSNVFAILGLRSLYFLLASMLGKFHYLKHALILILGFVGVKMLLVHSSYKVGTGVSLAVVAGLLAAGVVASLLRTRFSSGRKS